MNFKASRKMFPVSDRIDGWKQLFIPVAYIGITVTFCCYFLNASAQTERLNLIRRSPYQRSQQYHQESEGQAQHSRTGRSQSSQVGHSHQEDNPEWINLTAPMHFPWPNDESCKHFPVRFANKGTFKLR